MGSGEVGSVALSSGCFTLQESDHVDPRLSQNIRGAEGDQRYTKEGPIQSRPFH